MRGLAELIAAPGRATVAGAPEGRDVLALADLRRAAPERDLMFIARDDARMSAVADALAVFAPAEPVLRLPAWDCLPYDRVSPRADLCAQRLHTLSALLRHDRGAGRGVLVLTTVNAVLQRLPPRAALAEAHFAAAVGEEVDVEALSAFLARNGYQRVGTVMEPGEYSVRGGIIDLFAPGADQPVRLDLFGDRLEGLRAFDPITQRTTGQRARFDLVPVSEVVLDDAAIGRFRAGYRDLFGAVTRDDALYEAVSAGRRHPGVEHWLALFHDRLDTVFDYLPEAAVALEHLAEPARDQRLAAIADYYEARLAARGTGSQLGNVLYNPVPPARMFLAQADWGGALGARAVLAFTPFAAPAGEATVIDLGARRARDFAPERRHPDTNLFDAVCAHARAVLADGRKLVIACASAGARDRLVALLSDHGLGDIDTAAGWDGVERLAAGRAAALVLWLEHGFRTPTLEVLSEQDILGDRLARPSRRPRRAANFLTEASALEGGDLVVHIDHGIGRYQRLEAIEVAGAPHDCLLMLYAGGDKLYLPVENIDMLSRYGGGEAAEGVQLDRLGGAGWQARKARIKERLRDMAEALIRVAAERALRTVARMAVPAGLYEEFAARFPYAETDDQRRAIDDCLADLAGDKPMDRLVCGDVGFGKTEVALRAAFVATFAGNQVAVVVPTTLLCRQHYQTFKERFAGLPVHLGQLSRLVPAKEASAVRQGLAEGKVDLVIGTHALLAKGVSFSALGLLVVDEEQHFGVAQKERLKQLKADVHVLTMTATPIPRTLQLAVSGVRDLSLIATPPVDRLAVRTFVTPYDPVIVREALMRERYRGGQSFYICPRIEDLDKVAAELARVVPELSVAIAHGRLAARRLEDVMAAFYDGKYDVLLSTSIIESGLDLPRVNTLIVHRSDMFGLSQLYQLRGRIGRSKTRAYAYFTVPSEKLLKGAAEKRLHVIQTLDTLGAGFSLASHDLDIRGAGNLLGEEQSGHIREVGLELYQQMLEEAVQAARRGAAGAEAPPLEEKWSPQIAVGIAVLIPDNYVADLGVRLGLYRRLSDLEDERDIDAFAAELADRFGPLPGEVENLLKVVRIKLLCRRAGVEKVEAGPKGALVAFRGARVASPDKLIAFIGRNADSVRLRP
ncbi:MAG TPA: transcription-repair coupling factor, partial [Alphaproteobacteria bacterium]